MSTKEELQKKIIKLLEDKVIKLESELLQERLNKQYPIPFPMDNWQQPQPQQPQQPQYPQYPIYPYIYGATTGTIQAGDGTSITTNN